MGRGVRQVDVFSPNLFNLCSEAILWEVEFLPVFIISVHNPYSVRYAGNTILMADGNKTTFNTRQYKESVK